MIKNMNTDKHPLLQQCEEVCWGIQKCGAGREVDNALKEVRALMSGINALIVENERLKRRPNPANGAQKPPKHNPVA